MRNAVLAATLALLSACTIETGNLQGQTFTVRDQYAVDLPGEEWTVKRSKRHMVVAEYLSDDYKFDIALSHSKSNGAIAISVFPIEGITKERSDDVLADDIIARWNGVKVSQRTIKSGPAHGYDITMSGSYMVKIAFFRTSNNVYLFFYQNTPAHFDSALADFDHLVSSFRLLRLDGNEPPRAIKIPAPPGTAPTPVFPQPVPPVRTHSK